MYIRTNARLGYFGALFNIDNAINANRKYMSSLGWQVHFDDIVSRLLGFTMYTPGEGEFAERVRDWQEKHSLQPDGIIGPNTWSRMKSMLITNRHQDTRPKPVKPSIVPSQTPAFNTKTQPWKATIQFFGGRLVDSKQYPYTESGFQHYLDDTGVKYFSAKEMITPNHPSIASKLGYNNLLPRYSWWPRGAALSLLADRLRLLINRPIRMRNWWRPSDYNKKVGGKPGSDHIMAFGIDLDYKMSNDRRMAERLLKKIRREHPWLRMSLGLGNRTTHIGLLSQRGERTWHYKSYRQ